MMSPKTNSTEHSGSVGPSPSAPRYSSAPSDRLLVASPWRLMWWRFKRHRIALTAGGTVILLVLVAIFAEFLATGSHRETNARLAYLPPQRVYLFDGGRWRPHVIGIHSRRDPDTLGLVFENDPDTKIPVHFFANGTSYRLFGIIPTSRHLFGVEANDLRTNIYLFGTDKLGRDVWSRLVHGTRISMSIGLVGVAMSPVGSLRATPIRRSPTSRARTLKTRGPFRSPGPARAPAHRPACRRGVPRPGRPRACRRLRPEWPWRRPWRSRRR